MTAIRSHPASLALCGLLALAVGIGIARFVYTPILPYMVEGLGMDRADAGLIASANFLGYLVGALWAARASLPGPRHFWLLGAAFSAALTTGAMAFASSMIPFLLLRFAGGVASALVMVLASALVLERLAALGRSHWAAIPYAGVGTGIALSAVTVSATVSAGGGWSQLWFAGGAVSIAAAAAVWVLTPREDEPSGTRDPGPAARNRSLSWLILAYGLFGFAYVITATFISDIVRADPVLQPAEHLVWFCVGLAAAPSVAVWGWAGRRWGNNRSFAAACVVGAAGVALSSFGDSIALLVVAAVLFGGTFMGLTAVGLIHARDLSVGDPRRSLALMTASFGFGQMIGPFVAGLLHDQLGSYLVPTLLAITAFAAAAGLALRMVPRSRADAEAA